MKDIDNQEWKGYVTQCISGKWPVPPSFVSDKNNWVCRAIVGRVLYFIKDTEGAMRVLSTFINDVTPDMDDHPDQGMCEAEHFVLSLRDIAEIISEAAGTPDVGVKILGSHSCMTARGIRNASARTETRTYTGKFKGNRDLQKLLD